jgi:hypothetical protein
VIQKLFNSATVPTALPEMLISLLYQAQAITVDPDDPLHRTFEASLDARRRGLFARRSISRSTSRKSRLGTRLR